MPESNNDHRDSAIDARQPARATDHPTPDDPRSTPTADETRSTHHAHAHALAHVVPAGDVGPFPHEKLDAYRVALDIAALAKKLADEIPRGHRSLADHMLRAASNTVLLLAERR